jgi:hypothetical protein
MCQNGKEDSLKAKADGSEAVNNPTPNEAGAFISCRYCCEQIPTRARVCRFCQKPQRWWRAPPLELAGPIGIVIALGLLILGSFQYHDAKEEKISAATALRQASMASAQAIKASELASEAGRALNEQRDEINKNMQHLFSALCEIGGGIFNHSTFSCQLPDGRELKYEPAFPKNLGRPEAGGR